MALPYSTVPATAIKSPSPFMVSIPEAELSEFKALLKVSKVPASTYESLQEDRRFGVSHKWMTDAKKYWQEEFNWRKCEDSINSVPNFISTVSLGKEEHKVHFIALFSENPNAIPIALYHGWPGNFMEFLPILALMKEKYTPQQLPYHLIVPSLPGYAFSSPPPLDRDFSMGDIAIIMHQLMIDLGFESGYVAQGGDVGSRVAKALGIMFEACKAVHVNFSPVKSPPKDVPVDSLTVKEQEGIERGEEFMKTGAAYSLEHATRPSTIGMVLASSPLALLAWIGEKFLTWSDEDPSLEEILNSVTLYWLTETFPTSIYPYRSRFLPQQEQTWLAHADKPMGYSNFPKELLPAPKSWIEKEANLVFYRDHENGGHFAALEQPVLLMKDLEDFVEQVWVK